VGSRELYVAVPPDRDPEPVRVFQTFTEDLERMAEWLKQCGVTTVAMESTGVYWLPPCEVLERHGIKARVVDAHGMKNVPGRRRDWHDCQWLQYLHSVGLLRAAFRPEPEVCAARDLMRHRNDLVKLAAQHVQHMHKALTQMNLQIHHVIDDITGVTGMAIIEAIVGGERDAAKLAQHRDRRVKASEETIRKSLVGNWQAQHLFTLKQSLDSYRHYQQQVAASDEEIERRIGAFEPRVDPEQRPMPEDRKKKQRRKKNKLVNPQTGFDVRRESYKLFGVDLTQVPGLARSVLTLFTEVGRDMSRWGSMGEFVSWLGLCPDNDKSCFRTWRMPRNTNNRAGNMFRTAAQGLHADQTEMGAYLRRMKAKLGPEGATTATAHKIARIFYAMIKNQTEYDDSRWAEQGRRRAAQIEKKLQRQARTLGYELVRINQKAGA
jgi:transposase